MKISQNGLELIKKYESFKSNPYLCPAKKPTIGYGSTYYEDGTKVTLNDKPITEDRSSQLLEFIANRDFGSVVNESVKVELNQNQFDALVSFAYNVGNHNFNTSTLLRFLNQGNYKEASNQLLKWNRAKGVVLNGLTTRRKAERDLFLS